VRDAGFQLSLFAGCYLGYQVVRAQVSGSEASAFWNATNLIHLENSLNIFVEPAVQSWARGNGYLIAFADWMYLNSHYVVTCGALMYVYMRRNDSFYFVRNMFIAAMSLALVAYLFYPTAPPRLMPEWGFSDTIALSTGVKIDNEKAGALVNLYAAVPSMHVCFAILVGGTMAALTKSNLQSRAWRMYPLLVTWVVVATGNHYLLDALLGAVTAGLAWIVATLLAGRNEGWVFRPERVTTKPKRVYGPQLESEAAA
jgi:hypothetical protein